MRLTHHPISRSHPLRQLFDELVRRRFVRDVHLSDPYVPRYISGLLVDFTHVDSLYRIRNVRGKHLENVGEMLLESNSLLEAGSFDREREVRKHIGDYTLFMTGLFPEYVAGASRVRGVRLDSFVDFVKAGKESYRIVSSYDPLEHENETPLFRQLADKFELCVWIESSQRRPGAAARRLLPSFAEGTRVVKERRHSTYRHMLMRGNAQRVDKGPMRRVSTKFASRWP